MERSSVINLVLLMRTLFFMNLLILGFLKDINDNNCLEKLTSEQNITLLTSFDESLIAVAKGRSISILRDLNTPPLYIIESQTDPVNLKEIFSHVVIQSADNELYVYRLNISRKQFEFKGVFSEHKAKIIDFLGNPREGQVISYEHDEILFWSLEDLKVKRKIFKPKISRLYLNDRELTIVGETISKIKLDQGSETEYSYEFDPQLPLVSVYHKGNIIASQDGDLFYFPVNEEDRTYEIYRRNLLSTGKNFTKLHVLQKHELLFGLTEEGILYFTELTGNKQSSSSVEYHNFFNYKNNLNSYMTSNNDYKSNEETYYNETRFNKINEFLVAKNKLFILIKNTIFNYDLDRWPVEATEDKCLPICAESACHKCHLHDPFECLSCAGDVSLFKGRCLQNTNTCQYGCLACDSMSVCTTCYNGYYMDSSGFCNSCGVMNGCNICTNNYTCTNCIVGYYLNFKDLCTKNVCQDPNCNNCTTSTNCSNCSYGYTNYMGMCSPGSTSYCYVSNCQICASDSPNRCSICLSGYYLDMGMCTRTSSSCYVSNCKECNGYSCSRCNSGYYNTVYGECKEMNCYASNCLRCSDYDNYYCLECEKYNYMYNSGRCGQDYYYYEGNNEPNQIVKIVSGIGIAICSLAFVWILILIYYVSKGQYKLYKKMEKEKKKKEKESSKSHQEMQPISNNNNSYSLQVQPFPPGGNPE
jgi:hypothetical protein